MKKSFFFSLFFLILNSSFALTVSREKGYDQDPCDQSEEKTITVNQESGYPLKENNLNPTFAYPGPIKVKGDVDIFITSSFLYWQILTEEFNFLYRTVVETIANNFDAVDWNYKYKPGFKVGIGLVFSKLDNWQLSAEYLRYHATNHSRETVESADEFFTVSAAVFPSIFGFISGTLSEATLDFDFDAASVSFGRWSYLGSRFIWYPFMGVKGWKMKTSIDADVHGYISTPTATAEAKSNQTTKFWAVGLTAGFEGKYLLGAGFRVFGKGSADLLYQESTSRSNSSLTVLSTLESEVFFNEDSRKALSPELELSLGLGWGTYFANMYAHFDLSAEYNFLAIWEHAAARNVLETLFIDNPAAILYLQGLNITAKIDF